MTYERSENAPITADLEGYAFDGFRVPALGEEYVTPSELILIARELRGL